MDSTQIDFRPLEKLFDLTRTPSQRKHRVLIVRHGQSEGNVLPLFYGSTDYPLTEIGKAQAKLLSPIFHKYQHSFDAFCSSNLTRAYETCKMSISALKDSSNFGNLSVKMMSDLYQINKRERFTHKPKDFSISEKLVTVDYVPIPDDKHLGLILKEDKVSQCIQLSEESSSESKPEPKGSQLYQILGTIYKMFVWYNREFFQ